MSSTLTVIAASDFMYAASVCKTVRWVPYVTPVITIENLASEGLRLLRAAKGESTEEKKKYTLIFTLVGMNCNVAHINTLSFFKI